MKSTYADVVIMSFNRKKCLERCLESVVKNTEPGYQLIIVDAGSTDGSREFLLKEYASKATLIFEDRCWSYAQSNNNAFRYSRSKYVALLNDDCEVCPGWLKVCVDAMENDEKIGHAAHVVLRADGDRVMSAGADILPNGNTTIPMMDLSYSKDRDKIENPEKYGYSMNYAYAGFGVYRRDILEEVGYLPEFPINVYWDDTDYGMKVNAVGLDVRLIPQSVIIHFMEHSGRENHALAAQYGRACFLDRWGIFLENNDGFHHGGYIDGEKSEFPTIYNGRNFGFGKYKPLPFPVNRKPINPEEISNKTWR